MVGAIGQVYQRPRIRATRGYRALRVSLRPDQLSARDSAERLLPKQDRQAWEVAEELEEELVGILFATHGRPAREDFDVGC